VSVSTWLSVAALIGASESYRDGKSHPDLADLFMLDAVPHRNGCLLRGRKLASFAPHRLYRNARRRGGRG
ncbi:MAG: hypothetical protein CCU26_00295, partial [Nitrospira sp. UW-LDO-01]